MFIFTANLKKIVKSLARWNEKNWFSKSAAYINCMLSHKLKLEITAFLLVLNSILTLGEMCSTLRP